MAYSTIKKPSDYFETLLSTGDGGSQTFTGLDFQPDFVWSKRRQTHVHQLYDSVRGAGSGKALQSDSSAAEGGDGGTYGYLSSFTSDGFASTAGSSNNNYFNASGGTYAFWNWKANGAGVANTDGSISSTVSANTTSGFSIVSYTGTGANATVGHGLGATPAMMICKSRTSSVNYWYVYHKSLGNAQEIYPNVANAAASSATWNSTSPTSSVFSIGSHAGINESGSGHITYCFAEKQGFSKFGSYTGNGNADGSFIYTGFSPAFVMIKETTGTGKWVMKDNRRTGINVNESTIYANESEAEGTPGYELIDLLSNGFKQRGTGSYVNGSGTPYIYMAFASEPLVGDNPATAR